jgi:hypothetical protein
MRKANAAEAAVETLRNDLREKDASPSCCAIVTLLYSNDILPLSADGCTGAWMAAEYDRAAWLRK